MKLLALFLSITLAVGSCAWAEGTNLRKDRFGNEQAFVSFPIKWSFSCDFPEKLRDDVRDGFRYWDDLTEKQLFEEVACGILHNPAQGIVIGYSPKEYVDEDTKEKIAGTAYVYMHSQIPTGGAIIFWKDWLSERNPNVRRSVSRHEVGHVLGFEHNTRWDSCLMYPFISTDKVRYDGHEKQVCWSELKAFRRHYR